MTEKEFCKPELNEEMVSVTTWEILEVSLEGKIDSCRLSLAIYEQEDSTPSVLAFYNKKLIKLLQDKIMIDHCE